MTNDVQLDTLEAKGLIRLASLRPELEYLFRHALVQDAAYGSLLKQERRELHGQVAEALEQLYPDRREELAPVLAMHFEQAGEIEKAIGYFAAAGTHAKQRNAIKEAFVAFDQAAELIDRQAASGAGSTDEANRRRRQQVEVSLGRAEAGYSFRALEDSFDALEQIIPAADELGDTDLIIRVHTLIALGRLQNGESPTTGEVKRSLDRIVEIGEAIGDPSLRAIPMALVGMSKVFSGPVRRGVADLEEALPLIETHMHSIGAAFARGALAIGYATLGEWDKAEAAVRQAKEIAARGDLIAQLDALIAESMVRSMRGQLDRAVPLAEECVGRAEETGATACMVVSSWILGDAFHRQGRFSDARDVLKRGSDISFVVDRKVWRPTLQAWLGSALAAMGDVSEDDVDEALATARSIGNRLGEAGILGKRGEAAATRGDVEAASADFAASVALLDAEGARPSLARTLRSWGEALRNEGRADEAEPLLRRSLALLEELGIEAEAGAVRATLALGDTKITFD
jgi:tetratricopeptide (TPR) repeat protein